LCLWCIYTNRFFEIVMSQNMQYFSRNRASERLQKRKEKNSHYAERAPGVFECTVDLKKGEKIRPDATRLVRTRPGWAGNPNASTNGIPGVAFCWLEVEGPLHERWPPPGYGVLFDDLPFEIHADGKVVVRSVDEASDARRLLRRFVARISRQSGESDISIEVPLRIYHRSRELGDDFTEAMISAMASALCTYDFLFLAPDPGLLGGEALASRLSFFLWNGPPDRGLLARRDLVQEEVLVKETERLLDSPRSRRFVESFLDYWLDLRDIHANTLDAELYPDYYLDDWLTESSLEETRLFFAELIGEDLPARLLVDADFAYVNERLASLYGLPEMRGGGFQRVTLPVGSVRGGLLTQSSILRVTANGTTTSPVIRGAWAMERIMGVEIPPPPS